MYGYGDLGFLAQRGGYRRRPGRRDEAMIREGKKRAAYLARMDQFYMGLEEQRIQFEEGMEFRREGLAFGREQLEERRRQFEEGLGFERERFEQLMETPEEREIRLETPEERRRREKRGLWRV